MNLIELQHTLNEITFRDWTFRSGTLGGGYYIQAEFNTKCTRTGMPILTRGRKWYISHYAITDEIVKTVWLAIEVALRHEAMEDFTYKLMPVFHPHTDIEALVEVQNTTHRVRRAEP